MSLRYSFPVVRFLLSYLRCIFVPDLDLKIMDARLETILAKYEQEMKSLREKVDALEKSVETLKRSVDVVPAETIELVHEDFLPDITEVEETGDSVETNSEVENAVSADLPNDPVEENAADEKNVNATDVDSEVEIVDDAEQKESVFASGETILEKLSHSETAQNESVTSDTPAPSEFEAPVQDDMPSDSAEENGEAIETDDVESDVPEFESTELEAAVSDSTIDDLPEDMPGDDEEFSLFGELMEEPETKAVEKPKAVRTLNDANASKVRKSISDVAAGKQAWRNDIPGPEVKDVRSAISLNDRVMFISTLFRDDSMLFQDVVSRINSLNNLDKIVPYLEETFPEWNMESDLVYRFMMAVRRKVR